MRGQTFLGTRPLVHVGFLKCWLAGGLNVKVVTAVTEAVQHCKQQSKSGQPVTVLVTGRPQGCSDERLLVIARVSETIQSLFVDIVTGNACVAWCQHFAAYYGCQVAELVMLTVLVIRRTESQKEWVSAML